MRREVRASLAGASQSVVGGCRFPCKRLLGYEACVADDSQPAVTGLGPLHWAVLGYVMDAAEPTWLMLKEMPEAAGDRESLEQALSDLRASGLLSRSRELSGNPGAEVGDEDDWWALTSLGWHLLGATPPSNYR
jgi:hypothetical protein